MMSTAAETLGSGLDQRLPPWTTDSLDSAFEGRSRRSGPKDVGGISTYCKSSHKPHRVCGVCGDRARSLHFGGLSCDSCKAFFRRAVQSGTYKTFQCPHQPGGWNKFCVITVASRKSCQKCRFEACVQIGMEISWVMSEAERQRLLITRMAKKRRLDDDPAQCSTPSSSTSDSGSHELVLLHKSRPLQDYLWPLYPDNVCIENFMSPSETAVIEKVKSSWTNAMQSTPPTRLEGRDFSKTEVDHSEMVRVINGSIKRFQSFAEPLFGDSEVIEKDKTTILRSCMLDLCILRTALNHFRGAMLFERYFPTNLHEVHCRFVKGLQELSLDQTTMLLFMVVILLSPDRPSLEQPKKVEKLQEYFLMLLYKYMVGRYGMPKASALYPKLLSKMADIQELSDCHQEQYLLFARHEVQSVKEELNRIQSSEGPQPIYNPSHYGSQHQLSPFDQTFSSPVADSPAQQNFMQSSMPSSAQNFYPQPPPLNDPNADGGYMSYEEKQGFFFDAIPQCQTNNINERGYQNTLEQEQCFSPEMCSPDAQSQMPFHFQPSQYNYPEKLPGYPENCPNAIPRDMKTEQDLVSCLESSLGSSLSSNYGSSPRTLNGEEYFSSDFSSSVFPLDEATDSTNAFFSVFNR